MATARLDAKNVIIPPDTPFDELQGNILFPTVRRLGELGFDAALADAVRKEGSDEAVRAAIGDLRTKLVGSAAMKVVTKKRDHAELRRQWWETYYRSLGFNVTVPLPRFSNRVWTRETGRGRVVTPRAPTLLIPYEAHMEAVGQGNHWTVKDEERRKKIVWEPTKDWYWYWADAQGTCPRLNTSWNDLTATPKLHLLSLEEYMPFWHGVRADRGRMLDRDSWCWLRTRFGPGALRASVYGGQVDVDRESEAYLSIPHGNVGGRAADVV